MLSTGLFYTLLNIPAIQDFANLRTGLSFSLVSRAFIIIIPVIFMATGIQKMISAFSRNTREAQTYLSILMLVGFLPPTILASLPIKPPVWMDFLPTLGQFTLISQMIRGEPVSVFKLLFVSLTSLIMAGVAVWMAIKLYNREKIVMSN